MTKNDKISSSLKKYFSENEHAMKGKKGWTPTEEQKEQARLKGIEAWDARGRVSDKHKRARNKANVYAYRARKYGAVVESSDMKLIRRIYENCPDGYHVDHIIALAAGGLHHQDNLQYLTISENCRKGKKDSFDESKSIQWITLM